MGKKKRTIAEPLPLQRIKEIRKIDTGYGDVFAMVDMFRDVMIQSGMTWDSCCYLPLTAYVELSSKLNLHTKGINVEDLFHLAAWRRYSQIYRSCRSGSLKCLYWEVLSGRNFDWIYK